MSVELKSIAMNKLSFKNNRFKIMQIADAQELPAVSPDTVKLIRLAIAAEQPDLIVFTGDQIYGIHPYLWGAGDEMRVKRVLTELLRPVTEAGVPFAVTFGNHDAESGVPNARQAQLFAAMPGYTAGDRRCDEDPGTFRLSILNEDGAEAFCVYAFDTHGAAFGGERSGISEAQLEWFRATRKENKTPALVFQHIPAPEYYNVIKETNKNTRDAVEAFGRRKGKFYTLPQPLKDTGGFMRESPSVISEDAGEFDTLSADGSVLAIVAGHDHNNSFVAEHRGMKLIYTQCAGFHVYGPHLKRGVRIFTLDENNPGEFTTYTRTWESLTAEKPARPLLEMFLSHTPSSVGQAVALAKRYGIPMFAGVAAAGVAVYCAAKKKKR